MSRNETSGRKTTREDVEPDGPSSDRPRSDDATTDGGDHSRDTYDILETIDDAIDAALRASVGLGKDATDALFNERAAELVAGFKQKGGQ